MFVACNSYVVRFADLILLFCCKEARVMPLLNGDERDARLIAALKHEASLAHSAQLMLQHIEELALADAVAIHDDARRLEARISVELDEKLANHVGQVTNQLL